MEVYVLTILSGGLLESVSTHSTMESAVQQFKIEMGISYEEYLEREDTEYNGLIGIITETVL